MRFEQYDDAVYAHTDYMKWLEKHGEETASAWLGDRRSRYGDSSYVPSAVAWRYAMLDAQDTDILWMTNEMMDLVQTAMESFDPTEPMDMDDIFIPKGFLVLPHPFYSLDVSGKKLAWRVLYWNVADPMITYLDDEHFNYDPDSDGVRKEPGVRFIQVSHVGDPDDFYDAEMMDQLKAHGHMWGIAHATAIPQGAMSNQTEMSGEGDHNGSWLIFWRVMQKLMAERIVLWDERTPGRAARRDAQRFLYPPSVLRVIELRRPRKDRTDGEQGEERAATQYSHRWIVRGHWRNQACGPNHSLRKQRWISAYEKGPEDLDLVIKTRVWNWDR